MTPFHLTRDDLNRRWAFFVRGAVVVAECWAGGLLASRTEFDRETARRLWAGLVAGGFRRW